MIIENKLNIENEADLAREEERISKIKAKELFETGYLNNLKVGTFEALSKIHKYIFDDIYYFAGEIRKQNIAKGNFRFVPITYIEAALKNVTEGLKQKLLKEINIYYPKEKEESTNSRILPNSSELSNESFKDDDNFQFDF